MGRQSEIESIRREIESLDKIIASIELGGEFAYNIFYYGRFVSRRARLKKRLKKLLNEQRKSW